MEFGTRHLKDLCAHTGSLTPESGTASVTQCNKLASPQTTGTGIYLEREKMEKVETGTLLLWKSLETIVV